MACGDAAMTCGDSTSTPTMAFSHPTMPCKEFAMACIVALNDPSGQRRPHHAPPPPLHDAPKRCEHTGRRPLASSPQADHYPFLRSVGRPANTTTHVQRFSCLLALIRGAARAAHSGEYLAGPGHGAGRPRPLLPLFADVPQEPAE